MAATELEVQLSRGGLMEGAAAVDKVQLGKRGLVEGPAGEGEGAAEVDKATQSNLL